MAFALQSIANPSSSPTHGVGHTSSLAVFELTNSASPHVVFALPFAEQVRRALIRNRVDTSHSEAITGKTVAGVPLEGHGHAHYFATDEDGDGRLDHVTVYCPRGFDEGDVEALGSLRTIYRRGNRPEVRMILIGLGGAEMFAKAAGSLNVTEPRADRGPQAASPLGVVDATGSQAQLEWQHPVATAPGSVIKVARSLGSDRVSQRVPHEAANSHMNSDHDAANAPEEVDRDFSAPNASPSMFAISRRWRSVTPFSLPRFPNRGGGKPPRPRDLPEAQLVQELVARGLPEPISIRRIEGYQPVGRPLIRWLEFQTRRFKGTSGKGLAGFEIEFAEPVVGPIAVGFGCHFGLGLFMPC